ncbi:hypothetical protein AX17_002990 [Amanita inopinata Kibby_2008]|nr:hypothetical protein AX17_002990 [Amanita inopinata Kibby_2008]
MPRKDTTTGQISAQAQQDLVSEGIENFELPKSIVTRIAKSAIPENAKLQKETILSLIKGSTVFINYLAATAHDVAQSKQHKSISASDVLKALELIEFGDLVEPLQSELSGKASSSTSAPPNAKKAGATAPTSASAQQQQQQQQQSQSATAPAKTNLKARIKNPKASSGSSAPVTTQKTSRSEGDAQLSESVSAVMKNGHSPDGDHVAEDWEDSGSEGSHHQTANNTGENEQEDADQGEMEEEGGDEQEAEGNDEAGEEEEPVDLMEVEGVELRRDARGVEELDGD